MARRCLRYALTSLAVSSVSFFCGMVCIIGNLLSLAALVRLLCACILSYRCRFALSRYIECVRVRIFNSHTCVACLGTNVNHPFQPRSSARFNGYYWDVSTALKADIAGV